MSSLKQKFHLIPNLKHLILNEILQASKFSVCAEKQRKFLEKARHLSMIIKRKDKKKYASYCQALGAPLLMAALLF